MNAPIEYIPEWLGPKALGLSDAALTVLWETLAWVRHDKVPRREYYANRLNLPYTYGVAAYARVYQPQPWTEEIEYLVNKAERTAGCKFEVCFINGYENQSDQLGWHADDSPEMDDDRPIAIISLGVERDIMFRKNGSDEPPERLRLGHGSLCLMLPGMQDTHQHRIPKAGFMCGERISLTLRGYKA